MSFFWVSDAQVVYSLWTINSYQRVSFFKGVVVGFPFFWTLTECKNEWVKFTGFVFAVAFWSTDFLGFQIIWMCDRVLMAAVWIQLQSSLTMRTWLRRPQLLSDNPRVRLFAKLSHFSRLAMLRYPWLFCAHSFKLLILKARFSSKPQKIGAADHAHYFWEYWISLHIKWVIVWTLQWLCRLSSQQAMQCAGVKEDLLCGEGLSVKCIVGSCTFWIHKS